MSMSTVTIILFAALLICLFLNIPVGFSLGISSLAGLLALQAAGGKSEYRLFKPDHGSGL